MRILLLLLPCVLLACQQPQVQKISGEAMGTFYHMKYVGELPAAKVQEAVQVVLQEFDQIFSTYRKDSEISRFNQNRSWQPLKLQPQFYLLLKQAMELAEKSEGAFDPTMLPLLALYGHGPKVEGISAKSSLPSDAEIAAVMAIVGYQKLTIHKDSAVQKQVPGLHLDLNAMAKGYGVDLCCAALQRLGIQAFMVEIGGEVRCAGLKPDGTAWLLAIESAGDEEDGDAAGDAEAGDAGEHVRTVELRDQALATSGSYRQQIQVGETWVHHILDPRSGRNADNKVISVSVIAPSCALADGLATALMVLGPDGVEALLDQYPDQDIRVYMQSLKADGGLQEQDWRWPL